MYIDELSSNNKSLLTKIGNPLNYAELNGLRRRKCGTFEFDASPPPKTSILPSVTQPCNPLTPARKVLK